MRDRCGNARWMGWGCLRAPDSAGRRTTSAPGFPAKSPGRAQHERRKRIRAFSLVELIVVMVVIGIMAAAVLGEMRGTFEDAVLRSSARKVLSACNLAHSQAVTGHRTHRLRIDPVTGRYQIEEWHGDPAGETRFRPIPHVPRAFGELDTRISIEIRKPEEESNDAGFSHEFVRADSRESSLSSDAILFNPDGTSEQVEVLLRDRSGAGLALRVNPVTSRVRIIHLEPESP